MAISIAISIVLNIIDAIYARCYNDSCYCYHHYLELLICLKDSFCYDCCQYCGSGHFYLYCSFFILTISITITTVIVRIATICWATFSAGYCCLSSCSVSGPFLKCFRFRGLIPRRRKLYDCTRSAAGKCCKSFPQPSTFGGRKAARCLNQTFQLSGSAGQGAEALSPCYLLNMYASPLVCRTSKVVGSGL